MESCCCAHDSASIDPAENVGDLSSSSSSSSSSSCYSKLVQWIHQTPGGFVHDKLCLKITSAGRGVFAKATILAGETLITLPISLAISGMQCPSSYSASPERTSTASNWLRSIAAYYTAAQKSDTTFKAYLQSLPETYDSLLHWSDDEIMEYLAGTSLGHLVLQDRNDHIFESRYREAVRPYLQHLKLVPESYTEQEMEDFRIACMCVSTRGFHLDENEMSSSESFFSGPFLLPWMDLLNHDPSHKCTTLKWDKNKRAFYMEAERDIATNEEVVHSYNNHSTPLTSVQMLKTFGFVPKDAIQDALDARITDTISPATLTITEIKLACQTVAESSFPSRVRSHMNRTMTKENEQWEMDHNMTTRDLSFFPPEFQIMCSEPLSDELVTACSILLLPSDVYAEIVQEGMSLLGKEVLDDFYLGKLVCQAIAQSIAVKVEGYTPIKMSNVTVKDDDTCLLQELLAQSGSFSSWSLHACTA